MRHLQDKFGDPAADPYTDPWFESWLVAQVSDDPEDGPPDPDYVEAIRQRRRTQARGGHPQYMLEDITLEISGAQAALALLEARRDALVAELLSQGRSVRDVGALAGLSAMAVSRRRPSP
jgi:hypothetical protein